MSIRPGKRDRKHEILITGQELKELKRHTDWMAESFGLDDRIDEYQGKRPIGLYRWDLDCLLDVIEMCLEDRKEYPVPGSPEYLALRGLHDRLRQEYDKYYTD
jgi:hypothetical protein